MSRGIRIGNKAGVPVFKGDEFTLSSLTVTPSASMQVTEAPTGTAYNEVIVNAVTSSIDANIIPTNIKKDVQILGVTGSYELPPDSPAPDYRYVQKEISKDKALTYSDKFIDLTGVKDIDAYCLAGAYYNNLKIKDTITFPDVIDISGEYALYNMFTNAINIKKISFPSLVRISGNHALSYFCQFTNNNTPLLNEIDFPNLTEVLGSHAFYRAFPYARNITEVNFPSLTTVSGQYAFYYIFDNVDYLTKVSFPVLSSISGQCAFCDAFYGCDNLLDVYFPALTSTSFGNYKNQFSAMLTSTSTSRIHTIHFPSNLEPVISTLSGYPTFGGTSGYVVLAYDLPATN